MFREPSGDLWPRVFKVTTSLDLPHAAAELAILQSASTVFGDWSPLARLMLLLTCYVGVMQAVRPWRPHTAAMKEQGLQNIRDMIDPILGLYQQDDQLLNVCDVLSLSVPERPANNDPPSLSPHRPASLPQQSPIQSPAQPPVQSPVRPAGLVSKMKGKGKARAVDLVGPQQEAAVPKIAAPPSKKSAAAVAATPVASGSGSKYLTPTPGLKLKPNRHLIPYIDVPYVEGFSSPRPPRSVSPVPDRRAAVKALFRQNPDHVKHSDSDACEASRSGSGSEEDGSSDDAESESDDAPAAIISRKPAPKSTRKVKVVAPATKVTTKASVKKPKAVPRKAVTSPAKKAVSAVSKKAGKSPKKGVVPPALEGKLTAGQVKAIKAVREAAAEKMSSIMGVSRLQSPYQALARPMADSNDILS